MRKILSFVLIFLSVLIPIKVSALGTLAKAAILINADTGEVIYEHNADERLPMASTTKIMTALLLCENGDLEKEITVTAEMLRVEGSSMGLLAGDKVTLGDLLYGMMLASGNDAANVTAYVLGGTVDAFAKQMNEKAREIGMNNTNFVTPSGLDDEEHYSTARDMATLARYALQNETFAKAVACEKAVLNYGNPPYRRSLTNHNKLLGSFEGAIGVKTGFTKKSGRCLVSAAERDGKRVIAVTLKDPDDWQDHKQMLQYGLSVIKTTEIAPLKTDYSLPVINGEKDAIDIKIKPYSVNSLNQENFSCEVQLPHFIYAPVTKGEQIGVAVYKKNEEVIKTVPILAEKQISECLKKQNFIPEIKENAKYIFNNIWEK